MGAHSAGRAHRAGQEDARRLRRGRRGERAGRLPRQGDRSQLAAGVRGVVRRADHRHPQPPAAHRDAGAAAARGARRSIRPGCARGPTGASWSTCFRRAGSTRCCSLASRPQVWLQPGVKAAGSDRPGGGALSRAGPTERKGKVVAGARRRQRRVDPADRRHLQDVRRGQGLPPQDEPGQRARRAVHREGVQGRRRPRAGRGRATAAPTSASTSSSTPRSTRSTSPARTRRTT